MISIDEARLRLEQLKDKTKFEKMVQVTAILTKVFERENLKPIIVGGLAVEIYSRNEYTTSDIDIIFSPREIADKYLQLLDFKHVGRYWYHEELMISIEIPNDLLEDADRERVIELMLQDGFHVFVIGLEDIILDRLRTCVHWKSSSDCEWGKRLFLLHYDRMTSNTYKIPLKMILLLKL